MKAIVAALTMIAAITPAVAEDALVEGGRSPDGGYEVRLVRTPDYSPDKDGSEYLFHIRAGDKTLVTVAGSGFRGYPVAKEYCKALWDKSGRFVAITDRDTRHSTAFHIVAVSPDKTQELEIPHYAQNALGRVDATEVDIASVSTPIRWDDDELIMEYYFTANGRRSYTCDVTLHVRHEDHSVPSVGLKAVTKPKENEG